MKSLTSIYAPHGKSAFHHGCVFFSLSDKVASRTALHRVSFLQDDYKPSRCVGLGMNSVELRMNKQLTEPVAYDLNKGERLTLPFDDCSFDAITNVVSVDYITRPLELFAEMHRTMKPGGVAVMSFSNRMFWHKVCGDPSTGGSKDPQRMYAAAGGAYLDRGD